MEIRERSSALFEGCDLGSKRQTVGPVVHRMALHIYTASMVDAVDWAWGDGDRLLRRVIAEVSASPEVPRISGDLEVVPIDYLAAVQAGFASRLSARHKDEAEVDRFLYSVGKRAGALEIYKRYFKRVAGLEAFCARLAEVADHLKWGVLAVEELDATRRPKAFRLDECLECAVSEPAIYPACAYQTGVIAGALRGFLGSEVAAVEDRCVALGDTSCRFVVTY
jgi:predicted hydrocarbon binding protein